MDAAVIQILSSLERALHPLSPILLRELSKLAYFVAFTSMMSCGVLSRWPALVMRM